jgi:hypothetical protein
MKSLEVQLRTCSSGGNPGGNPGGYSSGGSSSGGSSGGGTFPQNLQYLETRFCSVRIDYNGYLYSKEGSEKICKSGGASLTCTPVRCTVSSFY